MTDQIQIQVEQAYRSKNGWFADVAEYGLPDCTERFVHEDEVLAFLGANKLGQIPQYRPTVCRVWHSELHAWNDEYDEQEYFITLDEWAAENAGLDLESVLSVIINRKELRTIYKPLGDLEALQPLLKLNKTAA